MARDHSRRTEGSLLTFVVFILAAGFLLVFLAKTRDGVPTDAINLNTAGAEELSLSLEIDPVLSGLLIRQRQRLGGFASVKQAGQVTLFPDRGESDRVRDALKKSGLDPGTTGTVEFARVLAIDRSISRRLVAYRDAVTVYPGAKPDWIIKTPILDERSLVLLGKRLIVRTPSSVFWQFCLYAASFIVLCILIPVVIRRSLPKGDPYILPLALLLAGLGAIALFSLKDPLRETPDYIHQIGGIWLGMAALLAGALMPARSGHFRWAPVRGNLRRYTYVWALLGMTLTAALWKLGSGPEGVRLNLGFFQPVEVVKILLVLFVAGYLAERGDLLADALHRWRPPMPKGWLAGMKGLSVPRKSDLGPIAVMFGLSLVLFLIVRDMGPALLLFGVFLSMLYVSSGRSGIATVGLAMISVGFVLAYRLKVGVVPVRVDMWLGPWTNSHRNGMQLGQSLWAMASGWIPGTGLGLGSSETIPRGRDDLVFSTIAEQMGLVGTLAILVVFAVLIQRGLRASLHAHNDFDRLLAAGLTSLLGLQSFLIIAGVTGILPLTGITLPFMSFGNSSLVCDFFLLGLLRAISAPGESVSASGPNPLFRKTLRNLASGFAVALLGVLGVGRLMWVQAIRSDEIAGAAIRTPDADGVVRSKINPRLLAMERQIRRGSIYDRSGKLLATSDLNELSQALPDDPNTARRYFRKGRYYPRGPALAHLVGYLDPSIGGPVGVEKEFNHALRGFDSYADLLSYYRVKDLPQRRSIPRGQDVWLTLDADLQEQTFSALKRAAANLKDTRTGKPKSRGAMVILEPQTGYILVSVSIPSFDPNTLTPEKWRGIIAESGEAAPFFDRARSGAYPPGSSLKVATAAAGLEEGIDPAYVCNHASKDLKWAHNGMTYALRQLQDDKGDPPHGKIKMAHAMRVSCNLYYANLGLMLGPQRLRRAYADHFELRGVKPLNLFAADLATNAFGQGTMTVSPIEMARIAASIANRGRMMQPMLARELKDGSGQTSKQFSPTLMGRPLGELNASRIADMMRSVVTDGTARGVFDSLPVQVAGKTGTAQTTQGDREPHSWFIGFSPFSKPQFAFACVIENGGYGKRGAAPVVRDVLKTIFQ